MIKIIEADIFLSGCELIAHQVNCQGVMGATGGNDNLALQMKKKFPLVFRAYRKLCKSYKDNKTILMGMCQVIHQPDGQLIANLFGQLDYGVENKAHTSYDALRTALHQLHDLAISNAVASIAFPYNMGCNRAIGKWENVYNIIDKEFGSSVINVLICKKEVTT